MLIAASLALSTLCLWCTRSLNVEDSDSGKFHFILSKVYILFILVASSFNFLILPLARREVLHTHCNLPPPSFASLISSFFSERRKENKCEKKGNSEGKERRGMCEIALQRECSIYHLKAIIFSINYLIFLYSPSKDSIFRLYWHWLSSALSPLQLRDFSFLGRKLRERLFVVG